jgi:hypothetical protein
MKLLLALALLGCGTTGDPGGGADHLPVSGGGPFAPLMSQPGDQIDAPVVLLDPTADLDDPDLLVDGEALTVFVTTRRKDVVAIEQAHARSLRAGFGDLEPVLAGDQPWEQGAVAAPSVVRGSPWLLFYSAAGAIGLATSRDGDTWEKRAAPVLVADATTEGATLGAPAAVRIDDQVRLYYEAGGSIWAAQAPLASFSGADPIPWTRLDGEPSTVERDPMVRASRVSFGAAIARPFARAGRTPADRLRHDLVFTVETGQVDVPTTCGYAGSFSGFDFAVAQTPILPPKLVTRAPTVAPYEDGAVAIYVQLRGVRDGLVAAKSP